MNEHTLAESLADAGIAAGADRLPAQADVLLLQQLSSDQLQARRRRFAGLLREQDDCPHDNGGAISIRDDQTVAYLADGARVTVHHASGALGYVSGLAPAEFPFAHAPERAALVRLVQERAHKLNLADWAGPNAELRFENLFRTLGRGADRAGRESATTLFRAIGAYRQYIGGIPVLGAASGAIQLAGDGRLDGLSLQVRPANGEVLERAALIAPEAGARQILAQLSALLGQRDIPADMVESAAMQFGYLDLGKRKPQRLLAPSYVAKIVLRHKTVRQAYVLAAAATGRPYLDLPVFGSEAPVTRGRTDIGGARNCTVKSERSPR
jgi:hypothetical protein